MLPTPADQYGDGVLEDPTARFAAILDGDGERLPLDEAALLIAAHALPDLDVTAQCRRLDALAGEVTASTLDGLLALLVDTLGFAGDRLDYHDPANSLLPAVLDRRRGIPLSLAIVAIEVGRRCGVPLLGVGMPGHFLLCSRDAPDRFVDLYDGATDLDRSDCRSIFERLHPADAWEDRFLEPVSPQAIVIRLLANLANSYRRAGDRASLAWALDLRLRAPGSSERDRRELAMLLGAAGRYDSAAVVLEATGQARDRAAAARMRARLN